MPQRNGAAVNIQPIAANAEFPHPNQRHAGKCLIHLIQIYVVLRKARALQDLLRGRDGAGQHQRRIRSHRRQSTYPRARLSTETLCRALRLRDNQAYVYIVMLSVRNSQRDTLTGLAAGADDYLVKGAAPSEILARINVGRRITRLEQSLRAINRENGRLAVTDALTVAHNRRYLMKYLPREVERSRRYCRPLAVLSCDIDRFKTINDRCGHETGDQVLQEFVKRAASRIRRAADWIARIGGDEFVIVLPETTLHGAECFAKKLCHVVASQPILTVAGPLSVTASIGVTAVEMPRDFARISALDLLRVADYFLYLSKSLGRNRATAAPVSSVQPATLNALPGVTNDIN